MSFNHSVRYSFVFRYWILKNRILIVLGDGFGNCHRPRPSRVGETGIGGGFQEARDCQSEKFGVQLELHEGLVVN